MKVDLNKCVKIVFFLFIYLFTIKQCYVMKHSLLAEFWTQEWYDQLALVYWFLNSANIHGYSYKNISSLPQYGGAVCVLPCVSLIS